MANTRKFSDAQTDLIAGSAIRLEKASADVLRFEGELEIAKENLKLAKIEQKFAQNGIVSATRDALAGKEPIPNLFTKKEAQV